MNNISKKEDKTNKISTGMKTIILMGMVSLFMDFSTDMVYPILPLYLVMLGSSPFIIGVIEGIAEGLAAILKSVSGYISDKFNSRKPLAIAGYGFSLIYKIGLLLSTSWVGVLISRIIDKTGKGLRTAPRDAIVASNGGNELGKGFGMHKMFDMLGSALGILTSFFILLFTTEYKLVIILSVIPAFIAVFLLFFVKDKKEEPIAKETTTEVKPKVKLKDMKLDKRIILYLVVMFIFSVGNSSNAFLLLRGQDIGFSASSVLLLYFTYNIVASLLSIPFGKLSDKIGRTKLVFPSYIMYALVYIGFAFINVKWVFFVLFGLYGCYTALISGAEKAMISELSPKEYKATILGLSGTVQGVGLIIASFVAGGLWETYGSMYALVFGASLSLIAAILVLFIKKDKKTEVTV